MVRLLVGGGGIAAAHLYLWPNGHLWLGLLVDGASVALIMSGTVMRGHR